VTGGFRVLKEKYQVVVTHDLAGDEFDLYCREFDEYPSLEEIEQEMTRIEMVHNVVVLCARVEKIYVRTE
jgi:hypothetical protein